MGSQRGSGHGPSLSGASGAHGSRGRIFTPNTPSKIEMRCKISSYPWRAQARLLVVN